MISLSQIIEQAQENHYQSEMWCKNCDSRWLITVPYTLDVTEKTEETKEKEKQFHDLHNRVCPKCGRRMTDTIRFRTDLTKEFEEVCDRPWNHEPI